MTATTVVLRKDSPAYEQFTYPAGEHQVRFRGRLAGDDMTVIARINNGDDIVKLALLKNAIGKRTSTRLVLPYLPYSRADRQFTDGDCFGLEAFGSLVNSMNFSSVITMDVHNAKVARHCVSGLHDVPASQFIDQAIVAFAEKHHSKHVTVLFPDEGARTRYKIPTGIETNTARVGVTVAHCQKKRDAATGKLAGFEVPPITSRHPAIIIDDICDGGATFTGIAKQCAGINLALYVTHGIFSKGHAPLLEYFDHLYTTNTIEAAEESDRVTVYDAMPTLLAR